MRPRQLQDVLVHLVQSLIRQNHCQLRQQQFSQQRESIQLLTQEVRNLLTQDCLSDVIIIALILNAIIKYMFSSTATGIPNGDAAQAALQQAYPTIPYPGIGKHS